MRSMLLLAVLGLFLAAAPARAQITFMPMVGYDIDYEAFQVGLGFEFGITPGILPISLGIRPSVEYVFVDEIANVNADLFRVNGDVIGRLSPPLAPLGFYGKAGVGVEFISVEVAGVSDSNTEVGANLGGGVIFNNFFVDGTLGLGDISDFRINVGYRF